MTPIDMKPTPIPGQGYLLYECQQGSPQWLALRAGVITASEFVKARGKCKRASGDKEKGDWLDSAEDLAFKVAYERISTVPLDENHQTWQMKRGHELEPFARMAHEMRLAAMGRTLSESIVATAGFMTTPDGKFGCSVDGLIGTMGGAEYKCLVSPVKLRKVIIKNDISMFMDQIQGCMWISGREWWHFGLYCPALEVAGLEFQMEEVARDDDYIEGLITDLLGFERLVTEYEEILREKGGKAKEELVEKHVARLFLPPVAQEPAEVE